MKKPSTVTSLLLASLLTAAAQQLAASWTQKELFYATPHKLKLSLAPMPTQKAVKWDLMNVQNILA